MADDMLRTRSWKGRILWCILSVGVLTAGAGLLSWFLLPEVPRESATSPDLHSTLAEPDAPPPNPLVTKLAREARVVHAALAIHLLGQSSVAKDLDLTEDQREVVSSIAAEGFKVLGMNRSLVFGSGDQKDRWGEFIESVEPLAETVEVELREALTEAQYAKLTQMTLQTVCGPVGIVRAGPITFLQPVVTESLSLSNDQCSAIAEITIARRAQITERGAIQRLFTVEQTRKSLHEGRQAAEELLTSIQYREWCRLRDGPEADDP